ncbi:MAG: transglycosylase family protein [Ornithinimicrobium sp.]
MTIHSKHRAARKPVMARGASALAMAGAVVAGTFALAPAAQADSVWDRVAACESGGDWSINTGNGYYGGLQFSASTWSGFGGGAYASTANLASKSQQITIAQRVLDGQGPGAWPTCSVEAGLTRANGGASSSRGTERASTPVEQSAPQPSTPTQSAPQQESAPAPTASAAPAPKQVTSGPVTRYVSADVSAYVRSGPSYDNAVIDSAARGTQVSGPVVNGWVKIGEGRYIGNSVLSSSAVGGAAASSAPAASGTVTQYVTADIRAYVRSGPSYDNAVIDKVDRGTAVTGEWDNGWLKIGEGRYIGKTMLAANAH